jgi:hypothetical protein
MPVVQFSAARAGNGRFAAGVSGNPAGRPKGSKNRSTLLMAALGEADAEAMVAAAVAKAKAGDGAMLRCLVTRILPAVRSRPVELAVPEGRETDLRALHDATLRGLAQGGILPDEALMIARALEKMARALATAASAASPSSRRSPRRAGKKRGAPANRLYSPAARAVDGEEKEIGEMNGIEGNGGSDARSASGASSPASPTIPQISLLHRNAPDAPSTAQENPRKPDSSPRVMRTPSQDGSVPPADPLFSRPASRDGRHGAAALVDGRLGASLP